MASNIAAEGSRLVWRDAIALAKPRLSLFVLLTSVVGMVVAPGGLPWLQALATVVATMFLIGAANAVNCYMEREQDALMRRTRQRPLAAGRIEPIPALVTALLVAAASIGTLWWAANLKTMLLGALAFLSYVVVYTPMKYKSALALYIGAIPGALPPLMGWVAVTDSIDLAGLSLFGLLFFWQLPHFLAISLYLKEDYVRGGMKVYSVVYGDERTKLAIFVTTLILTAASLLLVPLNVGGLMYGVAAVVFGVGQGWFAYTGLKRRVNNRWARQMFVTTLMYIPVLCAVLVSGF